MGRSSKGSSFEREICGQLSLWWTEGKRDDVFWRAASSGGRAKFRGRKGKDTHGQHGDIIAVDPIGEPLIDLFTIELKRGYNGSSFQDLLDRLPSAAAQKWEGWLDQVTESAEQAGSFSFLLITRRDRRTPLITMSREVWEWLGKPARFDSVHLWVRILIGGEGRLPMGLVTLSLADFLREVTPARIKRMAKTC